MMKLGKGMKVFPLPKTINELREHFIDQVKDQIGDYHEALKFDVEFVEYMEQVDGMMFNLTITPTRSIPALDMIEIAKGLDAFCTNEEAPFEMCGRKYQLGDGDDSLAVFFDRGRFNIWLRGWAK